MNNMTGWLELVATESATGQLHYQLLESDVARSGPVWNEACHWKCLLAAVQPRMPSQHSGGGVWKLVLHVLSAQLEVQQ